MKAPDHPLIHCWRPWSRRTRSSFCVFIRSPKTPNDIQMRFCASSHSGQGEVGQTILGCIKISADLYIYRFRPSFAEEHGQGMKYCHLKPTERCLLTCVYRRRLLSDDIQMRFAASSYSGHVEARKTILGQIKISADIYICVCSTSFAEGLLFADIDKLAEKQI